MISFEMTHLSKENQQEIKNILECEKAPYFEGNSYDLYNRDNITDIMVNLEYSDGLLDKYEDEVRTRIQDEIDMGRLTDSCYYEHLEDEVDACFRTYKTLQGGNSELEELWSTIPTELTEPLTLESNHYVIVVDGYGVSHCRDKVMGNLNVPILEETL